MKRLAYIVLLLAGTSALAQNKLTLTIDRTIVGVGEAVNLVLSLSGSGGAEDVQMPSIQNLQVVAGPYTSTSYEIVNGRSSSSVSWTYRLRATKEGREQIGPIQVIVGGKPVASNHVVVNVVSASSRGSTQTGSREESPDVFIRVVPDKSEVYQGEQVTLTYRIYFAAQISQPEIVKLPSATGFWVEELTAPQQQTLTDDVVNGRAYKVGVLRRVALFPTTTGELNVEPMVITTKVQRDARRLSRDPFDLFNDPFFSLGRQLEPLEIQSPAVVLRAKALPSTDIPKGFSGAVGSYRLRFYVDKLVSRTNEALTLTVQIEGTGNIKTLPEPFIAFPPDLEHYDPKATEQIRRDQQRIGGTKRFEYIVIPRAPGEQVIPPIEYVFFDPSTNKYSSTSTVPLSISVEKGSGMTSGASIPVATKRGVESIATDIAYIKTQTHTFIRRGLAPHESATFWLLVAGPWAALAVLIVVMRRRTEATDPRRSLGKAMKLARAEIIQAEKCLKKGNQDAASRHISLCMNQIAGVLLNETPVDFSDPKLSEKWAGKGHDPGLFERLLKIEQDCDQIRFTPSLAEDGAMRDLLERARALTGETVRMRNRAAA